MKKLLFSLLLISCFAWSGKTPDITTHGEKTGWIETGRAEETERLCHSFEKKFPSQVKCRSYGKTPEKRNLMYLVVGDPASPVVWVQAGIHAGEIDGKDAVFLLLKEILEKKRTPNPLKGLCIVFVPIVNLDGHERFGAYNRPNQIGPKEMGWRTTSQNINLNRDFLKVDSSEMRDLLNLWHKVDPVLSLDLHVTDGAQFQPEVGLIIHPKKSFGSSNLHEAGSRFEDEIISKLKDLKHLALPFYPSFENDVDPQTGFSVHVSTPRFAHGYWYNNNRLGVLVESHSWKDYATRVKTHHDVVLGALEIAQRDALSWRKYSQELDRENLAGKSVPLSYKHNGKFRLIEFPGYKYSIKKSKISGADVIKYDPATPQMWKVPFYEELQPVLTVIAPAEGYYLQPADAELILPKLNAHGVIYSQLKQSHAQEVEVFRAIKTKFSVGSLEGHQNLVVEGEWKKENVEIPAHSIFIPINQPRGRLLLQMFEPLSLDSFLWWGFFNRAFERKEYMEDYVAEDIAVEMLKNPVVKKEFAAKLNDDAEFAKSAEQRFEFFYRKHSSWDVRFNRYPVFRK
jgi:hypothetical protein